MASKNRTCAQYAHDGVFITTPKVTADEAEVQVDVTVENTLDREVEVAVETVFALELASQTNVSPAETVTIPARQSRLVINRFKVTSPQLWSVERPLLYVAQTRVTCDDQLADACGASFGIRSIEFTPDRGFLLNGKRVPLNGVCLHHDLGPLGAAVSTPRH